MAQNEQPAPVVQGGDEVIMFLEESINTLKAGWFELKLAKIFGKKSIGTDGNTSVTLVKFRGKYYLVNYQKSPVEETA